MSKNWYLALAILDALLVVWNFNSFRQTGSILALILAAVMCWFGYGQFKTYMQLRAQEKE